MLNKLVVSAVTASFVLSASLLASSEYIPNLNDELSYNKQMINGYKETIKKLEKRDKYLLKVKSDNPQLYVSKPLYENRKDEYIYRIKLNGAKSKNLNFTVKNHIVQLEMNLKTQRNDKNGYYSSTQAFYQEFTIPKNVDETKITNKIDGDYFEIIMPKK